MLWAGVAAVVLCFPDGTRIARRFLDSHKFKV
jgi:hypothetical protein